MSGASTEEGWNGLHYEGIKAACDDLDIELIVKEHVKEYSGQCEIAIKELETWHSGYRPVGREYVYMNWSAKQITLRDTWEKGSDTNYWQAG